MEWLFRKLWLSDLYMFSKCYNLIIHFLKIAFLNQPHWDPIELKVVNINIPMKIH